MLYGAFKNIIERVNSLDVGLVMDSLFNLNRNDIEDVVISLNQDEQLFEKGIDSEGVRLDKIGGGYTQFTINVKRQSSLPFDRVTLFQDGDFYDSFFITLEKDGIVINADTTKVNARSKLIDLRDRWGENILGLTDESKSDLIDFLLPLINDFLNDYLTQDN